MRGGTDYAKNPRPVLLLNRLRKASLLWLLVGAAVVAMAISWRVVLMLQPRSERGGRRRLERRAGGRGTGVPAILLRQVLPPNSLSPLYY